MPYYKYSKLFWLHCGSIMKILVHFGYQSSKHLAMFSLLRDGGVFPLVTKLLISPLSSTAPW